MKEVVNDYFKERKSLAWFLGGFGVGALCGRALLGVGLILGVIYLFVLQVKKKK